MVIRINKEAQRKEFEEITKHVIKWLCENYHPHVAVVIDPTTAVLYEGKVGFTTHEYIRD